MSTTRMRALRGATTVDRDDAVSICEATRELLTGLLARNGLSHEQLVSAFFTVTDDLHSEFPARAARDLGWENVAMLCSVEMSVPGALPRCIRVLLHAEIPVQSELKHVYLRGAEVLRPDL